jgi:hypothetical protein
VSDAAAVRANGLLPEGIHEATWQEFVERFGTSPRRRQQQTGRAAALRLLASAGCVRVFIGGSFVTTKDEPGDFDVAWDVSDVDADALDAIFFDFADERAAQKARFGGEFFPAQLVEGATGRTFLRFFQYTRDDVPVGVVVIALRTLA